MKKSPLTKETEAAILETAWQLIVERGSMDVSMSEIAGMAGVTRQTIYFGFGNRAGLLVAMARHADAASVHTVTMAEIAEGQGNEPETLLSFVDAWLAHLPEIYPIGVLLSAASVTDEDAATVFADRMVGALHAKYLRILTRISDSGNLKHGWSPIHAADYCWSLTHIDAWRHLVIQRGWSPEAFLHNRKTTITGTLFCGK